MPSFKPLVRVAKNIRHSFWFLPASFALGFGSLALGLVWVDMILATHINEDFSWLFQGTPDAARTVLSVIAGALITVVSISFTLVVIAIQQAATNYSPRVLRSFIEYRGNQLVLGMYIATFLYALLVLRAVRSSENGAGSFVPKLSVNVGILLTFVCLALLIFFINHIVRSLEVSTIIRNIYQSFLTQIERLFPEEYGGANHGSSAAPMHRDGHTSVVTAHKAGFVESIDVNMLKNMNTGDCPWVHLCVQVGEFVYANQPIAIIGQAKPIEDMAESIRAAVNIAEERTNEQDPLFAVRQLVDIALRALSPGINDPTTAEYCIYHLTDGLQQLGSRAFPPVQSELNETQTRFFFDAPDWDMYIRTAFDQLRVTAAADPHVLRTIVHALERIGRSLKPRERRRVILEELQQIQAAIPLQQTWTQAQKADFEQLTVKLQSELS